jgi:hypothetical protein
MRQCLSVRGPGKRALKAFPSDHELAELRRRGPFSSQEFKVAAVERVLVSSSMISHGCNN